MQLQGFSIHGVFQTRILEWVSIFFSRGSSLSRNGTRVSHIAGRFFTVWATREAWDNIRSSNCGPQHSLPNKEWPGMHRGFKDCSSFPELLEIQFLGEEIKVQVWKTFFYFQITFTSPVIWIVPWLFKHSFKGIVCELCKENKTWFFLLTKWKPEERKSQPEIRNKTRHYVSSQFVLSTELELWGKKGGLGDRHNFSS